MSLEESFEMFRVKFRAFLRTRTPAEIRFIKWVIDNVSVMHEEQITESIQIIASVQGEKKPSNKDEFDRIMKDLK